jgi:hypothetical protein
MAQFLLTNVPDLCWDPSSLLSIEYWGLFQEVKRLRLTLIIHFPLGRSLRHTVAILPRNLFPGSASNGEEGYQNQKFGEQQRSDGIIFMWTEIFTVYNEGKTN